MAGLAGSVRRCRDWREITTASDIDAVLITLPHSQHRDCAEHALRHGKHVFLEKPLATTLADALSLVNTAREEELILMVNMTHRFYPPLREARRLLQEGCLGDVISVRDHYMEVIDRSDFPEWFFDPVAAGGGVTMTDSIHLLDRVSWLLAEPLTLVGQVTRKIDVSSEVEDCSEILCRSASGIPVAIGSFFCFNSTKTWQDNLTIFGTKGSLSIHAWSHVDWTPHGQPVQRIEGYLPNVLLADRAAIGHRAALQEFLTSIRENRQPEAAGAAVLDAQQIVQQFYDNTKV